MGASTVSVLELSLAGAALLIGLTGAWSPCGFSMVETIGLAGDGSRRRTTLAACATFVPGAVVGGVATFGALSLIGEAVHGAGGRVAYVAAALCAIAAAVAEARGVRIVPQIRRQLPERWRWTMPLPVAAGLYGILLGLGFTTFVLSFGVWALAGISLALGDPMAGLVIGAAFGVGRALPVVVVAPVVDRPMGIRCIELMAERPAIYRAFRLGDALTLGLVAVVLTAATANAARTEVVGGTDPSAAGTALAFQSGDGHGVIRVKGRAARLGGHDPALGGPFAAVISGRRIQIHSRFSLETLGSVSAPNATALAISRGWLSYLIHDGGRYVLQAQRIRHPADPGTPRRVASARSPAVIGHPSLSGPEVVYTVSRRQGNLIRRHNLKSGKRRTVMRSRDAALLNPSLLGKRLLYVRVHRARQGPQQIDRPRLRQTLMIKRIGSRGKGQRVYRHSGLWTTSLSENRAFVTILGRGRPRIKSVKR
ncbi:MAG: hypothetical protein ACXWWU_03695 [Candidatus Limnocylindria bacterium]